jgi:hypothetical protein
MMVGLGAQVIMAQLSVSNIDQLLDVINSEMIKRDLITKLIYEIQQRNCIEFTKQSDPNTDTHTFRARICVLPDSEIKEYRLSQQKNTP